MPVQTRSQTRNQIQLEQYNKPENLVSQRDVSYFKCFKIYVQNRCISLQNNAKTINKTKQFNIKQKLLLNQCREFTELFSYINDYYTIIALFNKSFTKIGIALLNKIVELRNSMVSDKQLISILSQQDFKIIKILCNEIQITENIIIPLVPYDKLVQKQLKQTNTNLENILKQIIVV